MRRRAKRRPSNTRNTVHVGWYALDPALYDTEFEALVDASGVAVVRDGGRGRDPWYSAHRGKAERALRAKCVALLGRPPDEVSV